MSCYCYNLLNNVTTSSFFKVECWEFNLQEQISGGIESNDVMSPTKLDFACIGNVGT